MNNNQNRRVIVLNHDGTPLAPTNRFGMVRRWINSGEAKLINKDPQVIQFVKPRKSVVNFEKIFNTKMSKNEQAYVKRKQRRGELTSLNKSEVKHG